jgi:hypothetical protein
MTSNRKLLYQRYVEKTTPNSSSLVSLFSEQNLENCYFAGGYFVDANGYDVPINRYEDGVTDVGVSIKSNGTQMYFGVGSGSSGRPARFIIRYTKTTDSPLASDVKFAGVDENGNVIYKKTFTGTWSATTTAETKTFPFASTLKLRKTEGVYHTQYGDWSINTLNYNVSNNRLDYGVVAYTDPSNNTLVVERKGFYLSPLSGRSFEVDVYYTTTS